MFGHVSALFFGHVSAFLDMFGHCVAFFLFFSTCLDHSSAFLHMLGHVSALFSAIFRHFSTCSAMSRPFLWHFGACSAGLDMLRPLFIDIVWPIFGMFSSIVWHSFLSSTCLDHSSAFLDMFGHVSALFSAIFGISRHVRPCFGRFFGILGHFRPVSTGFGPFYRHCLANFRHFSSIVWHSFLSSTFLDHSSAFIDMFGHVSALFSAIFGISRHVRPCFGLFFGICGAFSAGLDMLGHALAPLYRHCLASFRHVRPFCGISRHFRPWLGHFSAFFGPFRHVSTGSAMFWPFSTWSVIFRPCVGNLVTMLDHLDNG